eukprot:TRINITY_DN3303_c1_g1_i2.p1 TRINITY_DN3303_c1_g1~~TRINITY_DN3303_c1_g1_i2.p1  ORF type:complete len:347 (+),score=114.31 TRINITY_DN3303_c1_g1_i2:80-1042(+)
MSAERSPRRDERAVRPRRRQRRQRPPRVCRSSRERRLQLRCARAELERRAAVSLLASAMEELSARDAAAGRRLHERAAAAAFALRHPAQAAALSSHCVAAVAGAIAAVSGAQSARACPLALVTAAGCAAVAARAAVVEIEVRRHHLQTAVPSHLLRRRPRFVGAALPRAHQRRPIEILTHPLALEEAAVQPVLPPYPPRDHHDDTFARWHDHERKRRAWAAAERRRQRCREVCPRSPERRATFKPTFTRSWEQTGPAPASALSFSVAAAQLGGWAQQSDDALGYDDYDDWDDPEVGAAPWGVAGGSTQSWRLTGIDNYYH